MQRHAAWRTRALCRQAVASSGGPSEIECRWIAVLLGDYLDGRLPRHTRELIDFHIDRCPPCVAFINTYRGAIEQGSTRGLHRPPLQHVIGFIQDNMTQKLTLLDLSTVVHMSPYHFARLFKQSTGVPPHRFVLG